MERGASFTTNGRRQPRLDTFGTFLPWWWEAAYQREGVEVGDLSDEERALVEREG